MFVRVLAIVIVCAGIMTANSNLFGQEKSKSWFSKMFSRSAEENSSGTNSEASPSARQPQEKTGWSMPMTKKDVPASLASTPKRKSSTFGKIGQTSKRWWDNTVDFVNPFNDNPKPPKQQGYVPQSQLDEAQNKKGGLFGWARREPEPEPIRSPIEFLKQPRPE